MVTDDSIVDRRIIAEANTLVRTGHEVVLLAGPRPGERFEQDGAVKIERWEDSDSLLYAHALRDRRPLALSKHGLKVIWRRLRSLLGRDADIASAEWTVPQALWQLEPLTVAIRTTRFAFATLRAAVLRALNAAGVTLRLPRSLMLAAIDAEMAPLERWKVARLRFYRPDAIHVHDLPQLRAGVFAKLALDVPLIYDAHEIYPAIHTLSPEDSSRLSAIERRYIRFADASITVNEFIAKELAARYGIAAPHVIWNAIDPPPDLHQGRAGRKTLRELVNAGPDAAILLFQGWLSSGRGLPELVRAMAMVEPRIHLVLLGYGSLGKELSLIATDLRLQNRVHFLDAVPHSELLYITATADAGIIPYQPLDLNNQLCSPNKLFEYIQARLPIIANDLPFLRKIVGTEGFGVVANLDAPESFARAIGAMFDRDGGGPGRFRRRLATQAPRFSWASQEGVLLDVYRTVVGSRHSVSMGGP